MMAARLHLRTEETERLGNLLKIPVCSTMISQGKDVEDQISSKFMTLRHANQKVALEESIKDLTPGRECDLLFFKLASLISNDSRFVSSF